MRQMIQSLIYGLLRLYLDNLWQIQANAHAHKAAKEKKWTLQNLKN